MRNKKDSNKKNQFGFFCFFLVFLNTCCRVERVTSSPAGLRQLQQSALLCSAAHSYNFSCFSYIQATCSTLQADKRRGRRFGQKSLTVKEEEKKTRKLRF